jgi:hypothetical protein
LDYLHQYLSESDNLDQVVLPTSVGVNEPILTELVSKMIDIQFGIKAFNSVEAKNNPLYKEKAGGLRDIRNSILESV